MEKSWLLRSLYIAWITFLLHIELVQTRIYKYDDDDNDYIQVYDRAKMKENERYRRSASSEKNNRNSFKHQINTLNSDDGISSSHKFEKDSNNVAFVFWKHAKTTVIFILTCHSANTTNYNKHSNKGCKSNSKFYRSNDHGKTFQPITQGIQHAHLHSIYLSPVNRQFIVLTDFKNKTLYLTSDEGKSFKNYSIPFRPTFIYFHPSLENYIAAFDNTAEGKNSLYLSENRGITWIRVAVNVRNYFWARPNHDDDKRMIYIEKETDKKIDSKTASSKLYTSKPPYNSTRLHYDEHLLPYSVFVGETFVIVQRLYDRYLYVSARKSSTFAMATFNKEKEHRMQVVVSDENDEILLALVHKDLQASLYLSDYSGKKFRLRQTHIQTESIKSQVVPPKMDLYVVKGVFGTYIVNRRNMGSSITHDKGHTWRNIKVDNVHVKGGKLNTRCNKKCDLKLYLKIEQPFSDFTAPIISKANAPGIIIAQGHIGKYHRPLGMKYYVFLSTDGGYTWKQKLSTTNGYVILDHGGLIAATPLKYTPGPSSAQVTYSTDYGKNWQQIHLTKLYSRIAAIITEATASLLVMNVFGFLYPDKQGGTAGNTWIVWQFNFTKVLQRPCKDEDYSRWKHNSGQCVMGERSSNRRRIPARKCISGPHFNNTLSTTSCPCSYNDYACEEDFYRKATNNHSECVPINPKHKPIKICERSDFYIKSAGYRKLYGNKCSNGIEKKVRPRKEPCTVVKPGWMKIKASITIVGVRQPITFEIVQVDGFYNASYTWSFNDSHALHGPYYRMKTVTHAFDRPGKYNVNLRASNKAGISTANITISVIENLHLNAHIMYDHPLVVNIPKRFALKTFTPNGTLVMVQHLPSTKFMWSFDGVYAGDDQSIVTEYTFEKSGTVNVEVQVINSVSLEVYRERVSVYLDAIVVDVYFSPLLDKYNDRSKEWIIEFETEYKKYLDIKYELIKEDIADRVLVRGRPVTPTKLSIIIYDSIDSVNSNNSASAIAERIRQDINANRPLVKGYEDENIRVMSAHISTFSKLKSDKPKKYVWVYIIVAMLILATVISLIAYYRYRYKGILWCDLVRDNMGKQLIDDDDVDMDPEPPVNYNHH